MRRIKFWLMHFWCLLALDLRLYYLWSRFGRWLYEREYLAKPIQSYSDEEALHSTMEKWVWKRDSFWRFGDIISCPAKIESEGMAGRQIGDYDDLSVYAATALQDIASKNGSIIASKTVKDISLLTVSWMEKGTELLGGHNVCVFQYQDASQKWVWGWISNWDGGKLRFETQSGMTLESAGQVAAHLSLIVDAENIRWARVSIDLKTLYETGTAG